MDKMAKCFEIRMSDGKLLASLRLYDIQIVEKENGSGAPKLEAAKNGGNGNGDTMTEPQQRKLFRLLAERGIEGEKALTRLKELFRVTALKEVTKRDASQMIDRLLKEAPNGQPAGSPVS
jgi:hypothetical protein